MELLKVGTVPESVPNTPLEVGPAIAELAEDGVPPLELCLGNLLNTESLLP